MNHYICYTLLVHKTSFFFRYYINIVHSREKYEVHEVNFEVGT